MNEYSIVFHYPLPLDDKANSGSAVRPLRMLSAFKSAGCEVDLIIGHSAERKRRIKKIKNNIKKGKKYHFVYSESSTMPTALTDSDHLPRHPIMDWFFFRYCSAHNIPVGLFYRDIYWLFDDYQLRTTLFKRLISKAAYRFDLWWYKKVVDKLYLPSLEMAHYIPKIDSSLFSALPPGHHSPKSSGKDIAGPLSYPIRLFYVGGISNHYQLHTLFEAVLDEPRIELTICTRKFEWEVARHEYPTLTDNIKIIQLAGKEMEAELQRCDIAVLYVKPHEYWEFAAPVKLFEYIGYEKPILASEHTFAGDFVREQAIGWTIPYETSSLTDFFETIVKEPSILTTAVKNIKGLAQYHSWEARARQVIKDLTQ